MQFIDLTTQQKRLRKSIDARIKTVLDHGQYIMGPEVQELEKNLCQYTGATYCISCASGTDALLMVLMAWNVKAGDAVFMPPFTFFATAEMPCLLGATPIFVDIDPQTFNMRSDLLERAIQAVQKQDASIYPLPKAALETKLQPKVVIPVDLFGQAADYAEILAVSKKYNLLVLEDAAQSFGGSQQGVNTCNLSCHAAATSFFPAKPLGGYGDGGAIFTNDADLAHALRSIRVHGKGVDKYDNIRVGINGRLDTLQAAILLAKLEIFAEEVQLRQQVATYYAEALAGCEHVILPYVHAKNISAWAQYCILLPKEKRELVMQYLQEKGIPTNIYYPKPQHALTVFTHLGYALEDMPHAYEASQCILALPFHPYLTKNDAEIVAAAIGEALA